MCVAYAGVATMCLLVTVPVQHLVRVRVGMRVGFGVGVRVRVRVGSEPCAARYPS